MNRPSGQYSGIVSRVGVVGTGDEARDITRALRDAGIDCIVTASGSVPCSVRSGIGRENAARSAGIESAEALDTDSSETTGEVAPIDDLAGCQVILRAEPDAQDAMAQLLRAVEAIIEPHAIYAADTSRGTLTGLARRARQPERIVGACFVRLGARFSLVEIVRGARTSSQAIARVIELMTRIGKVPIVVNDSNGLVTSRVLGAFVNEGMALVGEGVPATQVEDAALEAGLARGPLGVIDDISLKVADEALHRELEELEHGHARGDDHAHGHEHDHGHKHGHGDEHACAHDHEHGHQHAGEHGPDREHGHDHARGHGHEHGHEHGHGNEHGHAHDHAPPAKAQAPVHRHTHKVKSKRMPEPAVYVLEKMSHGFKRAGRAAGAGFYDYREGEPPQLWPGLKTFERGARQIPLEDVRERLLFAQALEAVRCLQEGVVDSADDLDKATVHGCGFPEKTGGAIRFVNAMGVGRFAERARELSQRYGERFDPPALLAERAQRGIPL